MVTRKKVLIALVWKFLEKSAMQGSQFIVQIILARLLSPEDFGAIALVLIFVNLAQVFIRNGLSYSLIQKSSIDDDEISSVFYINFIFSIFLYIILFVFSSTIANFFSNQSLTEYIRFVSLVIILGSLTSIQIAIISKELNFKKIFQASFFASLISGGVAIIMAVNKLGIWSLLVQIVVNQLILSIILWRISKWKPSKYFSIRKIKSLLDFGWKYLLSSFITAIYGELRNVIIGKKYDLSSLGYYNRGQQIPSLLISNIVGTLQSVMLPAFSWYQNDKIKLKSAMRNSILISSYLIFPIMIGMAVIAESIVVILLTEKWIFAVPYLQLFCIIYSLSPLHSINILAINSIGRSDIVLKLEIVKKVIGILILFITIPYGVYVLTIGLLLGGLIETFINAYPNKSLFNYTYTEQLKDIFPSLLISSVMGYTVYLIGVFFNNIYYKTVFQVLSGIVIYLLMSIAFRVKPFLYISRSLKTFDFSKIKQRF